MRGAVAPRDSSQYRCTASRARVSPTSGRLSRPCSENRSGSMRRPGKPARRNRHLNRHLEWRSAPRDDYDPSHREYAPNDAPDIQCVHRHIYETEVIDGERGEEVRGDNQPIDQSGLYPVDEG